MSPSTPAEHPTPRGPLKVYLSPDERAALQQLADEQDRSLSAILRLLLRRELSASAGNSTPTTAHDATRAPALDGPKAGFSICGAPTRKGGPCMTKATESSGLCEGHHNQRYGALVSTRLR